MLVPTVEITLAAPPRRGDEPFRGFLEPASPDRITVSWKAIDPARHALAVAGVVAGIGLCAAAALALFLHPALFVIGVIAGLAALVAGFAAQHVAGSVEADDEWLVVRGPELRRIYLPEVTSFDVTESGRTAHALAALRAGPPVVIGAFTSSEEARTVLAPLRAHWQRVGAPVADAPRAASPALVPAPPAPVVRAPRGLRARRKQAR